MKKAKILAAVTAAAVLSVSGGLLAGCTNDVHKHTYSEDWKSDANGHWHVATCDDLKESDKDYKSGYATHVWGDDNECDVCHYVKEAEAPIKLDKTTLTLGLGNTEAKLTATVEEGAEVEWSSDHPEVVAVGANGAVEAKKPGSATITATIKGTELSATCDIEVENVYYLIGGEDKNWNSVNTLDDANAIYFYKTETEGVYKTKSIELNANSNFQITLVGQGTNWSGVFNKSNISDAKDNVLEVIGDNNIGVSKHGKYTITLDLTGEKGLVSGVCDEEIDDGEVTLVYYLYGGFDDNYWTQTTKPEDVNSKYLFTDNQDGTYSLEIELKKGTEFKIALIGNSLDYGNNIVTNNETIGNSPSAEGDYQLQYVNGSNIGVGVSGTYKFTFNPKGESGKQLTYEFTASEEPDVEYPLHYYIKGSATSLGGNGNGGWCGDKIAANELQANGDGTYSITVQLNENDVFMLNAYEEDADHNLGANQKYYYNNGNTTLVANEEDITATTNYSANKTGYYTVTLDPAAEGQPKLTITYSAANPNA